MIIDKNKVLYIDTLFTSKGIEDLVPGIPVTQTIEVEVTKPSIFVEGYASTSNVDRVGDLVPTAVWEKGIQNYLKNPVILAYHDHKRPVGRMVDYRITAEGLWIKSRISPSDEETYAKIQDEVITAYSVSFRVLDAEYNSALEVFIVKELELLEISVVSVPANHNTLFSLSKSFANQEEYNLYKLQFVKDSSSAKGLESTVVDTESTINKDEIEMTNEELQTLLAKTASDAAQMAAKSVIEAQEKAAKDLADKAKAEAAFQDAVQKAVDIKVGQSGAEKLLADVEAKLAVQADETKSVIAGLEAVIKEKALELESVQKSKMQFSEGRSASGEATYAEKETAVLLAQITRKSIDGTKYGRNLIEKTGAHVASATWELEVSLSMESEVRRRLVVANTLRNITMQTNVMTMPVNPEASTATWITNAQFGTTDSPGATKTHALGEITLNAYKVATREYMAYEEEEDALLVLLPIVRDAMIRRLARSVDIAFLRGAGAGADPVKGLVTYDASSTVTSAIANKATVANMISLRRDLGAWGLDPAEIVYIVSTDIYYDLLDDTSFQTVDKIGDRATLLTGQIGAIANTPVLVSAEFEAKADAKAGAICYAPANFLVGNQRGLRMEMDALVETQRNVMVASLRTGMTQVTTNLGAGISAFRWTAT